MKKIEPYLFFQGDCGAAVDFYAQAIGAKVTSLMLYKDAPEDAKAGMAVPTGWDEKVMHVSFVVGETTIMASDGNGGCGGEQPQAFNGFSLSLAAHDVADAERLFDALAEDGKITMPLQPSFWGSPAFGMLVDRFGVNWMVSVCTESGT